MDFTLGSHALTVHSMVLALSCPPDKALPVHLSLLKRLQVLQVKSAFFAPNINHNILEGLTEPSLHYLICDEMWLKGDT